jgi:hypothetical protein
VLRLLREDWRVPRDWRRIWRDPAGWRWGWNCCCEPSPFYYYYYRSVGLGFATGNCTQCTGNRIASSWQLNSSGFTGTNVSAANGTFILGLTVLGGWTCPCLGPSDPTFARIVPHDCVAVGAMQWCLGYFNALGVWRLTNIGTNGENVDYRISVPFNCLGSNTFNYSSSGTCFSAHPATLTVTPV